MELGPSGFPFEKHFAKILNRQAYGTKMGQFLQGKCIMHEVDVVPQPLFYATILATKKQSVMLIFQ